MSETAKVRLVRCPKCENLLPEVTDFSVYQCGGCGAVLRAKNKGVDSDALSEKSDEERIGGTPEEPSHRYERIMNVSEKMTMDLNDGAESDVRSSVSSSSRTERRRILHSRAENNRTSLTSKDEKWDDEADIIQDKRSDEIHRSRINQDFEKLAMYHDHGNGSRSSGRMVDGRYEEDEGFWRARRMDPKVGPSNLISRSSYDYANPVSNMSDADGSNNVEYVGEDRAELLRKLDELKDRLSRSGNLIEKGNEKIPIEMRVHPYDPYTYDNLYPDSSLERNRALTRNLYPDAQYKRSVYQNQYWELPPLTHRQEIRGKGFYPPPYAPQGFGDPLRSHMHRRGPPQAPSPYQISPSNAYMSGPYVDDGMVYMDSMETYPSNFSRHHPSCPCYHCHTKRRTSTPILPTAYSDKYSNIPTDMIPNYHDAPARLGSRDYNHGVPNLPPLRSHLAQTHARWPSNVNSEVDGCILHRPHRAHLASSGKNCRPIAGGAPLLACYNCFELLLLTKKVLIKNNNRKKLRCGACSTVIDFTVSDKDLIVSVDVEAVDSPAKIDNKDDFLSRHGDARLNQAITAFSSDDYANPGYDSHSIDRESGQVSTHQEKTNKSRWIKSRRSTSTYTSEAEEDTESLTAARKDSGLEIEEKGPPPPTGLSLHDYFEYSNKFRMVKDSGGGNKSGRSEQDKVFSNKVINRQILRKESTSTEIDLSSNEYCNTGTTFDSSEASREEDHLKVGKGADSFFAGIMNKSYKDSQKLKDASEQENVQVTVNGHLISDRLIKKVEKLAGPIYPGHYWYDFRAGFWGAIGGPCLGIIPPFMEEFNYRMPENCAGGNTGVFVNGRELNQKDMNLLASRGLPMERDKSYVIEISGRVLDEDTGEELDSLGKLAPTVERMKRGFGMRAPKAFA